MLQKVTGDTPDDTIFCIFMELNRFNKKLSECKDINNHLSGIANIQRVAEISLLPFSAATRLL